MLLRSYLGLCNRLSIKGLLSWLAFLAMCRVRNMQPLSQRSHGSNCAEMQFRAEICSFPLATSL